MMRDLADIQKSNVWEQTGKKKRKDGIWQSLEKTLIVVGSETSGKTSFIKTIRGDLDFQTKNTCLLQYNYIKRLAVKKQAIHAYEVASKNLLQVIPSLISKDNFGDIYFVICVDLSKPNNIIEETIELMTSLRKQFAIFLKQKLLNKDDQYRGFQKQMIQKLSSSEDRQNINIMPLNTIIIGCKYDLYEKFDTQRKKWISRIMRYISHTNNASLFYSSIKNMQVGAQLRTVLSDFIFGDNTSELAGQKDHLKPIYIYNTRDSVSSMNLPTSESLGTIDMLRHQLDSMFPLEMDSKKEQIGLVKYNESKIDMLIEEKKKQLSKIVKIKS